MTVNKELFCPHCQEEISLPSASQTPRFCPFCGKDLPNKEAHSTHLDASASLVDGHAPTHVPIQFCLGPYQVLDTLGKGGMGEVFLAYDTICGRRIALKRIRSDLISHRLLHKRFLNEARITSQLTHPGVIPIFAIHAEEDQPYYTMPYVFGNTLKELLKRARKSQLQGEKVSEGEGSIPSLVRIFINICQAVAFAHSKGVLHRDLKPENIIVGSYGEVLILDWGLAVVAGEENDELFQVSADVPRRLTRMGKVVGTLAYMAPERVLGNPADKSTDIYALGVILYQILTLQKPFHRPSLKAFRKNVHREVLKDPQEIAPYRDVPKILCKVVEKCLAKESKDRYVSIQTLIYDLENYIEGRSDWFLTATLDIDDKEDWEFQENVFIAEHIAITRGIELSDWVSLMVSKESFAENIKIEAKVQCGEKGHGIGLLLSVPEAAEREHLNDGYCLWLASDINSASKLLRSTVEVVHCPDIVLKRNVWYQVRIEKMDNNIHVYINDLLHLSYISHQPLSGTHVGLLSRDADFSLKDFKVFVRGQNITVSCLAIPDAFFAHKDLPVALSEYRRIARLFSGRAEGYQAQFRAGVTLLEQAKGALEETAADELYELAHQEFEKLHGTPGAPFEYLGKALIYQTLKDYEEEAKCFELAWRRYPHHPLMHILEEQVLYRMHESSRFHRKATYDFLLFVVRHLPKMAATPHTERLIKSLEKYWEPLPYFHADLFQDHTDPHALKGFAILLAYWLGQRFMLVEMIEEMLAEETVPWKVVAEAFYALLFIGDFSLIRENFRLKDFKNERPDIAVLLESSEEKALQELERSDLKTLQRAKLFLVERAFHEGNFAFILEATQEEAVKLIEEPLLCYHLMALLALKKWEEAGTLLERLPLENLTDEKSPYFPIYGCLLLATEGREIASIHFSGYFDTAYPRSSSLLAYYMQGKTGKDSQWYQKAFLHEKRALFRQLFLFHRCDGDETKSHFYFGLLNRTYVFEEEEDGA